jgi:hypothetical protein
MALTCSSPVIFSTDSITLGAAGSFAFTFCHFSSAFVSVVRQVEPIGALSRRHPYNPIEILEQPYAQGVGACTLAVFGTYIEGTFEANVVNNSDVTDSMIHNVISMEDNPAYQRRQLDCGGA